MLHFFKKWWKFSALRFYILNAKWNYSFWLFAEKIYKDKSRMVNSDEYTADYAYKLIPKKKIIQYRKFIGYMYKGNLYLDNPGLQNIDDVTWKKWKEKGLVD